MDEVVNNDMSDEQMDSLVSGSGSESREIPMRAESAPQAPSAWQEDTLKVNGKEIKGTRDQILQWAQMGYNYPQKAQELKTNQDQFNQQRSEFENQSKEWQQKWSPYKEIDEYAAKNPDWWSQVQSQYKEKIGSAQSNPEIAELKKELQELKSFRDELTSKEQNQKLEQEDKALSADIESMRKMYPNIDFATPDGEGKNLEMKVLEHAMQNNIANFRIAFRDYYHDHLVSKAKDEGKEAVSKNVQARSKLGILGESSKPTKGLKLAENVRSKSYNDLMQEALDELKTS